MSRFKVMVFPGGIVNLDDTEIRGGSNTIYQCKNQLYMETLAKVLNALDDNGFPPKFEVEEDSLIIKVNRED